MGLKDVLTCGDPVRTIWVARARWEGASSGHSSGEEWADGRVLFAGSAGASCDAFVRFGARIAATTSCGASDATASSPVEGIGADTL